MDAYNAPQLHNFIVSELIFTISYVYRYVGNDNTLLTSCGNKKTAQKCGFFILKCAQLFIW